MPKASTAQQPPDEVLAPSLLGPAPSVEGLAPPASGMLANCEKAACARRSRFSSR